MPTEKEVAQLRARVAELEKMLEARQQPTDITAEEIAAYRKVSDVLAADWGEFCGINDCFRPPVLRCAITCWTRCIVRCIYECGGCGPCAYDRGASSWGAGAGRFEQFGG